MHPDEDASSDVDGKECHFQDIRKAQAHHKANEKGGADTKVDKYPVKKGHDGL